MSEDGDCPYYSIHGIILDYLKHSIPSEKQVGALGKVWSVVVLSCPTQ